MPTCVRTNSFRDSEGEDEDKDEDEDEGLSDYTEATDESQGVKSESQDEDSVVNSEGGDWATLLTDVRSEIGYSIDGPDGVNSVSSEQKPAQQVQFKHMVDGDGS